MADFSFSDNSELKKLNDAVIYDLDNYEHWDQLIAAAEKQEGGLNRNSSPSAIEATRNVYDHFLARFPLFFGYWKKYADLEFAIAGTEAADMVYERGIASVGNSVDLWTNYCSFKAETIHDYDVTRDPKSMSSLDVSSDLDEDRLLQSTKFECNHIVLFERGADAVGLDFMSHPFWDTYIEFEERADSPERVFKILARLIAIPLHQYFRYWTRFADMARSRPYQEFASRELVYKLLQDIVISENSQPLNGDGEEYEIRQRLTALQTETHRNTQLAVNARWVYESEIKRPYFHILALEEAELENWRKYLDYEENEGDYERTKFLYERCLVTAARYEEFWFRYARWMLSQKDKAEEVRNIYQRASCLFVSTDAPDIRLSWAKFEESLGYVSIATDIHDAILATLPNHVETIISLADLTVRQVGLEAGVDILRNHINNPETDERIRGDLVGSWANMIWSNTGDYDSSRSVWSSNQERCTASFSFWHGWLSFEFNLPAKSTEQASRLNVVRQLYHQIGSNPHFSASQLEEITACYLFFLQKRGDKESIKEFVLLDRNIYGPASVRTVAAANAQKDGPNRRG